MKPSRRCVSVSVVIPAYKAERTIGRAIDSVLAQTVAPAEIIVVDDGSPDHQNAVIETFGDRITLVRQPNGKTASARNMGIDRSQGDLIAFLDADDYWEPEKVQRQLAVLERHPEVNVMAGRFYNQSPGQERQLPSIRLGHFYDRPLRLEGSQAFMLGTMLWTGTVMVRRDVLRQERFKSGLEPAEDRDLWIRLVANYTAYLDSHPIATAVLEPDSISRASIAVDCSKMLEVINRNAALLSGPSCLLWKSYVRYRWAAIDPSPTTSLPMLMQSIVGWPLPFTGMPAMKRLGRLKRLAFLLRQTMFRSRRPEGVR